MFFWRAEEDSNLRRSLGAADLQSAALDHSAICPFASYLLLFKSNTLGAGCQLHFKFFVCFTIPGSADDIPPRELPAP